MELLALSDIFNLHKISSVARQIYLPLCDENILLKAIVNKNISDNCDFRYGVSDIENDKRRPHVSLPTYSSSVKNNNVIIEPLKDEIFIDSGGFLYEEKNWLNVFDHVFSLGEHYIQSYLWFIEYFNYQNEIEINHRLWPESIDSNGSKVFDFFLRNSQMFIHPISMIHQPETVQFFCNFVNKKYNIPILFTGCVYQDEYYSRVFINVTSTTIGQIFFIGALWELNRKHIANWLEQTGVWKNDPKSLYQYPVWHAYRPDFPKKWPWSKEYDGSEPEIALKYARHL